MTSLCEERSKQEAVLGGLLRRAAGLRAEGLTPVVLLDLDDTLLSTARRHLRILREFAASPGTRAGGFREALARLGPRELRYSIADTARAAGVTDEEILKELRGFWFDRFFRNEYLGEDPPVPGAPEYCRELREAGVRLAYLTGRDEAMREGTLSALRRHGFPLPDELETFLLLKPRFDAPDLEFKQAALRRVAALGEAAGGFENEPAHVNLFQETFPPALMVLVETKHSGKPIEPLPAILRIRDFLRAPRT